MTLTGPFAVSVEIVIFFIIIYSIYLYSFIYLIIIIIVIIVISFIYFFFFLFLFYRIYNCVTNCRTLLFCRISILTVFLFTFFVSTILVNKLVCLSVCLTFIPLLSIAYFQDSNLRSTSSLVSSQITISSANSIVHGGSLLTSSVSQSMITANRNGLNADPGAVQP